MNTKTGLNLEAKRHSLAHLLAAAVLELWPEAKAAAWLCWPNDYNVWLLLTIISLIYIFNYSE